MLICRIGSLEIDPLDATLGTPLICRIGSLEIIEGMLVAIGLLICRIGSLETQLLQACNTLPLICRIGSLEKALAAKTSKLSPYLPHRQLRK